jgi:hypothetical protein
MESNEGKTAAEMRAEIRRRKILEQGNDRIRKILANGTAAPEAVTRTSPPVATIAPLPGRDLTLDPLMSQSQDNSQHDRSNERSSNYDSPDEISDQLSNLSLGFSSAINSASFSSPSVNMASNLIAQSMMNRQNLSPNSSRMQVFTHLLLMVIAAVIGIEFKEPVLTSFLVMEPILLLTRFSSNSLSFSVSMHSLKPVIRILFDDLLIFIFISVNAKIVTEFTVSYFHAR